MKWRDSLSLLGGTGWLKVGQWWLPVCHVNDGRLVVNQRPSTQLQEDLRGAAIYVSSPGGK